MSTPSSPSGRRPSGPNYQEVIEPLPISLAILRLEEQADLGSFRYLAMSDRAAKSAGLKAADTVGKTLREVFPQSLKTGIPATLAEIIRTGSARDLGDNAFFDAQGVQVIFHIQAFPLPDRSVCVMYEDVTEERRLESELRRSEERLRGTFAGLNVGVAVVGPGTEALLFNDAALELLGLKQEQLTGRTAFDPGWKVIHEDGTPFRGDEHPSARAIATRKPVLNVVAGVHRPLHGDLRWLLCHAVPQLAADGSVSEVVCSFSDITERKLAEEALQKSENLLETILGSIPSIVFMKDLQGRYIFANPRFKEQLMRSAGDVLGKTDWELFSPEQASAIVNNDRKVLEAQAPLEFEEVAQYEDGPQTSIVTKLPLRDASGRIYAICGIATDITQRKRAEVELRESEKRFRLLVQQVKDYAIFMCDPEGRMISWNEGAERMIGYTAEEILQQHISRLYAPEDVERGRPEHLLKVAETEGRVEDESWRVRKDGSRFLANVIITALRDDSGSLQGFVKVTRDITERKRAEQQIQELSGRLLEVQDKDRRAWARRLHDSTSPSFASLISKLHQIKKRQGLDAPTSDLLNDSLSLAEFLVREIRNVSYVLHPPMLDEQGLLAALKLFLQDTASRIGIQIETDLPERMARLPIEAELALFRVVQEYLTNAPIPPGGRRVRVSLAADPEWVRLEVGDKGRGMPLEVAERAKRGAGDLGVWITGMRERMRQLGGRLEIKTSGSGTVVTAILPLT